MKLILVIDHDDKMGLTGAINGVLSMMRMETESSQGCDCGQTDYHSKDCMYHIYKALENAINDL